MRSNVETVKQSVRGITLIEILIVLGIIGAILAIVGPRIFGGAERADIKKAEILIDNYKNAIQLFQLDTGVIPEQLDELVERPTDEEISGKWNGPYMKDGVLPKDPWNRPFEYQYDDEEGDFFLYSWGKTKKPETRIGKFPKDAA
jgi:general secretion pathway protein G